MTSPDEIFWNSVEAWNTRQARIAIECGQQPFEERFVGTVSHINGSSVTFREIKTEEDKTEEELTLVFESAGIRIHPFEPIEAVIAFGAVWEPENEPFVSCVLTELRDFKEPS
jgi:hypothetical protein